MLSILNAPNSVLSQKSLPVKKIDKNILNFIEGMKQALQAAKDPIGVGLAAPQVGKNLRIFMAKPKEKSRIYVFINPKILATSNQQQAISKSSNGQKSGVRNQKRIRKLEGCLSLKDIWGEVQRAPVVTIEYMDESRKKYKKTYKGFMAIIVQHEIDHLEGILFPKRVLEQKGKLYRSEKDEKGNDVFEEIKI